VNFFGHEKGAFTGADRQKEGKFRQAHSGTIFLDEVSEMSPSMQVKLLRVLQEREITRVGGEQTFKIDVRVIAASNKELLEEVRAGRFREDLYYRLNVFPVYMPPLRDRTEDIVLLVHHFLERFKKKNNKWIKGRTPQAMDALLRYHWPGNVRELMNVIESAVVLSRSSFITEQELPASVSNLSPFIRQHSPAPVAPGELPLDEVEKKTILQTLEAAGGNKSETARRLGITRKTLHKKLKKYGVMQ